MKALSYKRATLARRLTSSATIALSIGLLSLSAPAFAQDAEEEAKDKDIVVTGTLIRGVAPAGASPITVSSEDIEETGASSVAQVLQTIPQLGSFNGLQSPAANSREVTTNRPNLRNLPGFNTGGGSSTLVLMDGHRLVGMGNATTSPDPDIIPPGILQSLEIVPDGGSAVYGSDAVSGVLNFITIKRFDGVKIDGNYGFGDNYYRYDANVTVGKDWGTGSIFASYNYAKGDDLLGIDRDYIRQYPDASGRLSVTCAPGNIRNAAGAYFALPGGAANTVNLCDNSDYSSLYPAYERHSVFAGLSQDLNDSVSIDIRAYYTKRDTTVALGQYTFEQSVPAARIPVQYAAIGTTQTVSGVFSTDLREADIGLETFGITPTITANLGSNWQLRVSGSYGESLSTYHGDEVDTVALAAQIASGVFNPYNPSTITDASLTQFKNSEQYGRTEQSLENVRAVVDGDLFTLPAGSVKIAVGAEISHETFNAQNGTTVPGFANTGFTSPGGTLSTQAIPTYKLERSVKSVFGEIIVPVLGGGDGPELTVSAAGRYDDYSDVGGTFNPRFGATFKPVEWISIRGAWGESFNAPSLADNENAASTDVFVLPSFAGAAGFLPPADLVANGTYPAYTPGTAIVAVRGNAPGIKPQTATTWTLGFDVEPPFIDGLSFGVSYYNIDFKNLIGLPPFQSADQLYRFNGNVITISPTQAQLDAAIASDTDGIIAPFGSRNPFGGAGGSATQGRAYALFDARKRNLGRVKVDGLDFRFNYTKEIGFGTLSLTSTGTYELSREQAASATAPFQDTLSQNTNRFRFRNTLGLQSGGLSGQVTWNYLDGYDYSTPRGFTGVAQDLNTYAAQSSIGSYSTFDLYVRYDVQGTGLASDLAFTLNVQNAFDQAPPVYFGVQNIAGRQGTENGGTIGRFIQIGVSKKF